MDFGERNCLSQHNEPTFLAADRALDSNLFSQFSLTLFHMKLIFQNCLHYHIYIFGKSNQTSAFYIHAAVCFVFASKTHMIKAKLQKPLTFLVRTGF